MWTLFRQRQNWFSTMHLSKERENQLRQSIWTVVVHYKQIHDSTQELDFYPNMHYAWLMAGLEKSQF